MVQIAQISGTNDRFSFVNISFSKIVLKLKLNWASVSVIPTRFGIMWLEFALLQFSCQSVKSVHTTYYLPPIHWCLAAVSHALYRNDILYITFPTLWTLCHLSALIHLFEFLSLKNILSSFLFIYPFALNHLSCRKAAVWDVRLK